MTKQIFWGPTWAKNTPGCLGCIGGYTTLYRVYEISHYRNFGIPIKQPISFVAHLIRLRRLLGSVRRVAARPTPETRENEGSNESQWKRCPRFLCLSKRGFADLLVHFSGWIIYSIWLASIFFSMDDGGFVRVYPISLMMGGVASMFMGRRINKHDFHQTEALKRSKFHGRITGVRFPIHCWIFLKNISFESWPFRPSNGLHDVACSSSGSNPSFTLQ